ncbi:unnamed protein product [Rotaria sordida]|nr:unnamed protein product [Rotaria sordida]CAF4154441.1 unnamed protein product [Rotaria sordida]
MRFDDLLPIVNQRKISNAIIKIDIETSEHFFISNRRIDVDIESSLTLKFALIIAERSKRARVNFSDCFVVVNAC